MTTKKNIVPVELKALKPVDRGFHADWLVKLPDGQQRMFGWVFLMDPSFDVSKRATIVRLNFRKLKSKWEAASTYPSGFIDEARDRALSEFYSE